MKFERCPCAGNCRGNFCCTDMVCTCYRGEKAERKADGMGQYDRVLRNKAFTGRW